MNETELNNLLKQVKLLWKLEEEVRLQAINNKTVEDILHKLDSIRSRS
jgi:hypothetical protein